jgi:hypothetical protein
VAEHGAVIALISYGVLRLAPDDLQERFDRFYTQEIGPYWPAERKLVDSGYADIAFPFAEMPYPGMMIDRIWELGDFLGYLSTWSAVHRVNEAGRDDILKCFVQDISTLWAIPRASCRSLLACAMRSASSSHRSIRFPKSTIPGAAAAICHRFSPPRS